MDFTSSISIPRHHCQQDDTANPEKFPCIYDLKETSLPPTIFNRHTNQIKQSMNKTIIYLLSRYARPLDYYCTIIFNNFGSNSPCLTIDLHLFDHPPEQRRITRTHTTNAGSNERPRISSNSECWTVIHQPQQHRRLIT